MRYPLALLPCSLTLLSAPSMAQGTGVQPAPQVVTLPVERVSDQVPLPVGRRSRAVQGSDEVLAEASGDPYFLGFAGGSYRPPGGERLDGSLMVPAPLDGRDGAGTYAFVMFEKRITSERIAHLERMGARVLGFHPHHSVKVHMTPAVAEEVSGLGFVRWVGRARSWQKVHPVLTQQLAARETEWVEAWVSVFDSDLTADAQMRPGRQAELFSPTAGGVSLADRMPGTVVDSGGWQQRALEELGIDIHEYIDSVRSFRCRVPVGALPGLLERDHVLFVEPVGTPTPCHDESTPLTNADLTRIAYDGGNSGEICVAIVDTGISAGHNDLSGTIGVGLDLLNTSGGAWDDTNGHGTHVIGTVLGRGDAEDSLTGVAPGVGRPDALRLFNCKFLNPTSFGASYNDVLAFVGNDIQAGPWYGPLPHIVNNSWGTGGGPYYGTEVNARLLDNKVWLAKQLHVFAAGNEGDSGTVRLEAGAKNAFAVGALNDHRTFIFPFSLEPGFPADFSSQGPTADGRWKPWISAPGSEITAPLAGTYSEYDTKEGTSMAAPHVTGVAAQLADRYAAFRYQPATLAAALMATTITHNGHTHLGLDSSSGSHTNILGAGKLDAYRSQGGGSTGDMSLYYLSHTQSSPTLYTSMTIPVYSGATRMTAVMVFHEAAGPAGGSSPIINNLDMWIDQEPFTSGGNTGEYYAHQSAIDNSEIRTILSPDAGDYRIKIFPEYFSTGFFNTATVGVAVCVEYADPASVPSFTVSAEDPFVQPLEVASVRASATGVDGVAQGIWASIVPEDNGSVSSSSSTLLDGAVSDLTHNVSGGIDVTLGNLVQGKTRSTAWGVRWATEGHKSVHVTLNGPDIPGTTLTRVITVDGTPPAGPTGLGSPTHTVGVTSCDQDVVARWTAATDALSGVAGHNIIWDTQPATPGEEVMTHGPVTSDTESLSVGAWYVHVTAVDQSGNWGTTQHLGPFLIGGWALYCEAVPNSTGQGAHIGTAGSVSVAQNDFRLTTTGLPPNRPCLYFYGTQSQNVPFGNGKLCVTGQITRLPVINTGSGSIDIHLDLSTLPPGGTLGFGSVAYFQNWYRDPAAGGAAFNLSDGLCVRFCE